MSDRPGSLAALARHCGQQDVNILGLQIFPGVAGVTDELVLRVPEGWRSPEVAALVEGAGGSDVSVSLCSEHALVDGPVQYLQALHRLRHDPAALELLLARLLDAESGPAGAPEGRAEDQLDTRADLSAIQASMVLDVGSHRVVLRRTAPFTATEHARALAFAGVAAELLDRDPDPAGAAPAPGPTPPAGAHQPAVRLATLADAAAVTRMHARCSTETLDRRYDAPLARIDERFARRLLAGGGRALVATVGSEVVALATLTPCEHRTVEASLLVEDGWQRRGLGTRLLSSATRLARGTGAAEVVMRSRTHSSALMSLAFACGLRARIRLDVDTVVVTVAVDRLTPLSAVPGPPRRRTPPTPMTPGHR